MEAQGSVRVSYGPASAAGGDVAGDGLATNREGCGALVHTRVLKDEADRLEVRGCLVGQANRLQNQYEREHPTALTEPLGSEIGKGQKRRNDPDRGAARTRRGRKRRRLRYEASCPPSRDGSASGTTSREEATPPLRYTASVEPERMGGCPGAGEGRY